MDRDAIRARFQRIKARALQKAEEEIRRERGEPDPAFAATIARWPRRAPRPARGVGRPRHATPATRAA